ncbi:hypothetical protein ACQKFU_25915 [Bacillus mycoides]|uniref:hypothetical protein n=1 Tax=Bacillus TaxID=1386 RepID=UPI0019142DE3|nr:MULTISPECIES: hypothetical protein [Bacillus]MBK5491075.1 hypothetical protein [Bacillus sp. TH17]
MKNLEEIVKEYVAIEMCEGSHSKNIDEYDNELDFHLENVTNSLSKKELHYYGVIKV